jgi:hypothetical protein
MERNLELLALRSLKISRWKTKFEKLKYLKRMEPSSVCQSLASALLLLNEYIIALQLSLLVYDTALHMIITAYVRLISLHNEPLSLQSFLMSLSLMCDLKTLRNSATKAVLQAW